MTHLLLQAILGGVILGALYGLIGASLALIYGIMRIVNLAHGDFVIAGAFVAYVLVDRLGFHPLYALLGALVIGAALGALIHEAIIRSLQRSPDPEMSSFLAFYGVSLVVTSVLMFVFDADTRSIAFSFSPISIRLGDFILPTSRLVAVGVAIAFLVLATAFFVKTLPGKALRAAVMNRPALGLVGISADRLGLLCASAAFATAMATGVLIAFVFPAFGPTNGMDYTIIGFITIVLGGVGNPVGALLGGIVFGVVQQVASLYWGESVGLLSGFLILTITIFFRPQGLLGKASYS